MFASRRVRIPHSSPSRPFGMDHPGLLFREKRRGGVWPNAAQPDPREEVVKLVDIDKFCSKRMGKKKKCTEHKMNVSPFFFFFVSLLLSFSIQISRV